MLAPERILNLAEIEEMAFEFLLAANVTPDVARSVAR